MDNIFQILEIYTNNTKTHDINISSETIDSIIEELQKQKKVIEDKEKVKDKTKMIIKSNTLHNEICALVYNYSDILDKDIKKSLYNISHLSKKYIDKKFSS